VPPSPPSHADDAASSGVFSGVSRAVRQQGVVIAGILVSVALIALASRSLDWNQIGSALTTIQPWPWIPLAVLSYGTGHLVRGIRTKLLVSRDAELSVATATNVVVLGYAVNNVLPARLGEFARAGMMSERTGLPLAQSMTVTLVERILDGWVLFLFFELALLGVPNDALGRIASVAGTLFVLTTTVVFLVLFAPSGFIRATARLSSWLPARAADKAIDVALAITRGMDYLRRPRDAARVTGISALVWLCEAGLFLFLLPAFGLPFSPMWALLALTVTNLGLLLPSTPGYVGVFHYFCQQALAAVGVQAAIGLSYAVVVHLAFYLPITLWGVAIVLWYGMSLGRTISMARRASPVPFSLDR
jgi:glycosyltransferase 2 family protein